MRYLFFILLFVKLFALSAQSYNPNFPPNTYRSTENPYYWKNKNPRANYWQQDVAYTIHAEIIDTLDLIKGTDYTLTYWNNSPDTLTELYFHLFQNAFQPHSHMHSLYMENEVDIKYGNYEAQGLGTTIDSINIDGKAVKTILDNTIVKVILNTPLLPNDSIDVNMQFTTYFDKGSLRRRMKTFDSFGYKHYDGVHWYPSVCVYDKKFGWTTEQHLDKEFYHNFGTFDIYLTFPQEYIVEATGTLINKKEVLPDTLREKLDIKHFKTKTNNPPSIIIPREEGKTKTWRFYAENVHNFAFTADPTYRIGELSWKGMKVITIVREPNAHAWQKSGEFSRNVIKTYSEDFGMYAWPKIVIADAEDGMEYPMLTLDGGSYPGHQGLLAHEIGHMWFYGMLGSNETYRAFLDEGFTQFLTIWALEKHAGAQVNRKHKNKAIQRNLRPYRPKYERLYYPYIKQTWDGFDYPLNTHSSDFNGSIRHGGGYGLVYFKTGVMLYNLKYVLGDSLFMGAMQHYVNKWAMAHPYPEDFREAIIEYTKTDLNWFFDQWLETTKYIDYSIKKVKHGKEPNTHDITFERKGAMQMPLDFEVHTTDSVYKYHIPNTWFLKNIDATTLPKWYGWGNINKTYTVTVPTDIHLKKVVIDPDKNLADIDLTNNHWHGTHVKTDWHLRNIAWWDEEEYLIGPDLGYNRYDGAQVGLRLRSNYFKAKFYDFSVMVNTGIGQYDVTDKKTDYQFLTLNYKSDHSLFRLWQNFYFHTEAVYASGRVKIQAGPRKVFQQQDQRNPKKTTIYTYLNFLGNLEGAQSHYYFQERLWSNNALNSSFNVFIERSIEKLLHQRYYRFHLRTPGPASDFNYSFLDTEIIHRHTLGRFTLHARLFGRMATGTTPVESALFLAGANPETMFDHRLTRTQGIIPGEAANYSNTGNVFHAAGGLNLRGYTGYFGTSLSNDGTLYYIGQSGASANIELDYTRMFSPKSKGKQLSLNAYLFADAGIISQSSMLDLQDNSFTAIDAGPGYAFTYRFKYFDFKPLTLRLDFPIYVNHPPIGQNAFDLRMVFGFSKSF